MRAAYCEFARPANTRFRFDLDNCHIHRLRKFTVADATKSQVTEKRSTL
jgi:hypothetical protein